MEDGETAAKCCPPIRDSANRDSLWQRLGGGSIELVVSDHSPCPPELKALETGDFGAAWGGISGLQLGLPAVWTQAWPRGYGLTDLARWMAHGPAALVGLRSKGSLEVGKHADLVAFDPDATFVVDPAELFHRHPVTVYAGRTLRGLGGRGGGRGAPARCGGGGRGEAVILGAAGAGRRPAGAHLRTRRGQRAQRPAAATTTPRDDHPAFR